MQQRVNMYLFNRLEFDKKLLFIYIFKKQFTWTAIIKVFHAYFYNISIYAIQCYNICAYCYYFLFYVL